MADCIERDRAVEKITELINQSGKYADYECGADDACFIVAHLPTADVRENVIRTQGDKLRAMSDEELKQWYCNHRDCGTCDYGKSVFCSLLDWLKSPVEVEE